MSNNFDIAGPGTAFPQSTATLTGLANLPVEAIMASKYASS